MRKKAVKDRISGVWLTTNFDWLCNGGSSFYLNFSRIESDTILMRVNPIFAKREDDVLYLIELRYLFINDGEDYPEENLIYIGKILKAKRDIIISFIKENIIVQKKMEKLNDVLHANVKMFLG